MSPTRDGGKLIVHNGETAAWLDGDLTASIPGSISYDSGNVNPIAFGHSASNALWVLMNVTNPDNSLLTTHSLPNTGRIVVAGSPRDGWKLTYWDGAPIPE